MVNAPSAKKKGAHYFEFPFCRAAVRGFGTRVPGMDVRGSVRAGFHYRLGAGFRLRHHQGFGQADQPRLCSQMREGRIAASDPNRRWNHLLADLRQNSLLRTERTLVTFRGRTGNRQRQGIRPWRVARHRSRKDTGLWQGQIGLSLALYVIRVKLEAEGRGGFVWMVASSRNRRAR
jgi:hypothetical protein